MTKKYTYWVNSGKYSMLQKMSIVVSGLFSFMILARLFTPEKFGVWGLFMVISSFVETLRHALIKNGYVLFINTCKEEEKPGYEYAALATNIVFSLVLALCFLVTAPVFELVFKSPGLRLTLQLYSFSLIFLIPYTHREFQNLAKMDFKEIFYMYFARYGVFLSFTAILFILNYSITPPELSVLYALSIVTGVFVAYFLRTLPEAVKSKKDIKLLKKFLHYGKLVLGTNFFSMVFRNTDSLMTAHFISPTALAYYNSSSRIINFAEIPTQVLGDVMYPRATQMVDSDRKGDIKNIYEKTVAASLTLIIPFAIIVFLFPRYIILVLAGNQYLDAAPIMQVLVIYSLFLPFVTQFGNIMDATGRPKINFQVMMIISIFNVGCNLIFIKYFGLYGPAFALLTSYSLLFVITQIILYKISGVNIFHVLRFVVTLYPDYYFIFRNMISSIIKKN